MDSTCMMWGNPNSSEYLVNSRSYLNFLISPLPLFPHLHLFISVLSTTFFYFQIIFLAHHKYTYYTDTSPGSKLTEFIQFIYYTPTVSQALVQMLGIRQWKKRPNIPVFIELTLIVKHKKMLCVGK